VGRPKNIKFGKVSIVVFLTALIWVWADLAQDERLNLSNVVVEVATSSDPALWVNFVVEHEEPGVQAAVALDTVVLKGPASRVADVERLKNKGVLDLDLFLVPEQEAMTQEGARTLNVLDFLKSKDEIRQLGLTVESCEPRVLTVQVGKLDPKSIPVECVGIDPSLQVVSIEPPTVEAYVPKDETRRAIVRLTPDEQNQAKNAPVEKTPYIELAPGQRREVSRKVKVTLAPAENLLRTDSVPATYGFCFSPNLQGKYRVILQNDPTELAAVRIKATLFARQAYGQEPFQILLYIHDPDIRATEPIRREFVFNFPQDYLRRDEIRADQPAPVARFTLEPIAEAGAETSGM
jgi:hypothetical protein